MVLSPTSWQIYSKSAKLFKNLLKPSIWKSRRMKYRQKPYRTSVTFHLQDFKYLSNLNDKVRNVLWPSSISTFHVVVDNLDNHAPIFMLYTDTHLSKIDDLEVIGSSISLCGLPNMFGSVAPARKRALWLMCLVAEQNVVSKEHWIILPL